MAKSKQSLNPLPKTLRERKRYLLFEVAPVQGFDGMDFSKALDAVFLSLYGSIGSAEINPKIVKFRPATGKGILCCQRGFESKAKAAFLFLKEVKGTQVKARSLRCLGTLEALCQSL
ncbi:MAG: Rpp14/Pop5 family protein [Candidatus Diapherotrites archaeon]